MSLILIIAAAGLTGSSGLAAALLRRRPAAAQRLSTLLLVGGAGLGVAGAALALAVDGPAPAWTGRWEMPGASLALRVDPLSAIFLFPVLALPALGAIYGLGYWRQAERGAQAVRLQLFLGLVTGAMTLVCVAANALLFLAAWEVMALSGFFLVLTEHERPDAQRAAFVYLAAAHAGNLALFGLFALLGRLAGSYDFADMAGLPAVDPAAGWVFGLALVGFGLKAGLVPLHFWLPGAHAAAPSHVSAVMSGVLLKTGIYGLLRITGFFAAPPLAWGGWLLAAGVVSGVLGVAFALAQHDLKRLLAYHSVENVGIIAMGLGLALLGRAAGDPAMLVLGFAGAVLHVVNHATFKGLLFLGAGAVHHATGTRELDRLGGLGRAMPRTAALFLVGATAISGLPPLNGFASEWLVYLGSFRGLAGPAAPSPGLAILAAPALALVGGLAAACFAKVVGTTFLGQPRSAEAARGHEPPAAMLLPMAALALACAGIGLAPALWLPALTRAAAGWAGVPEPLLAGPAALATRAAWQVSLVALLLLAAAGLVALWRRRRLGAAQPSAPTWGCGYAAPTPRMQYTGSSFAESLVLRFGWALFPRKRVEPPVGLFPRRAAFDSHVPDTVLDVAILPAIRATTPRADRLRARLGSRVQAKVLLLLVGVLSLLGWLGWR
jgi:formate hydrogenlyase subunit 3/multisubunit Na+/H+ antiporter MnhD subunit